MNENTQNSKDVDFPQVTKSARNSVMRNKDLVQE